MELFNPLQENWIIDIDLDRETRSLIGVLLTSVGVQDIHWLQYEEVVDRKILYHKSTNKLDITSLPLGRYWRSYKRVNVKELIQAIERIRSGSSAE